MSAVYVAVTVATAAATGAIGGAAAARAKFVLKFMGEVGVPESWAAKLGILKLLGAMGLLTGLALRPIGIAAGVGLVLFFVGAVIAHVPFWRLLQHRVSRGVPSPLHRLARAGDQQPIAAPAVDGGEHGEPGEASERVRRARSDDGLQAVTMLMPSIRAPISLRG